jgi:hypothetical protein
MPRLPVPRGHPERTKRYFREAPGTRRTHIHVRRWGSWGEQFALLCRAYVQAHTDVAARIVAQMNGSSDAT